MISTILAAGFILLYIRHLCRTAASFVVWACIGAAVVAVLS